MPGRARRRPQGVPVRRGAEGRHQAVGVQGVRHRVHAGDAHRHVHGVVGGRVRGVLQLRPVASRGRGHARAMSVTPPAYRPRMGYRGKVELQERARELRARNLTLQDIADRARRRQVVRLAVGPRRALHPVEAPHRPAEPSAPVPRGEARPDRRLERRRHRARRHARVKQPSSLPALRCTRARVRRPTVQ